MDGRTTRALASILGLTLASAGVATGQAPDSKVGGIVSGPPGAVFTRPDDFEKETPGAIAAEFTAAVGRWEVVQDGTNRVLAQLATNPDDTFNVVLRESFARDVDLSVRLKAVAGALDRGGGVVWRAVDARNYYIARYNPLEDNFRVYKVEDGKRTQFASAEVPGDDKWHTLRVRMVDDRITCYLDGVKHLEVRDSTFRRPGKVGLWTKSDARTYFDDLAFSAFE